MRAFGDGESIVVVTGRAFGAPIANIAGLARPIPGGRHRGSIHVVDVDDSVPGSAIAAGRVLENLERIAATVG